MSNPNRKVYRLSLEAILPALGFSLTWFCWLPIAAWALGAGLAAAAERWRHCALISRWPRSRCLALLFAMPTGGEMRNSLPEKIARSARIAGDSG